MERTFEVVGSGDMVAIAANFAYGREQLVPSMFEALTHRCGVGAHQAPAFHHYLHRHIELDGGHHGDMADRLVDHFVAGDAGRERASVRAASRAIAAREAFWDGVLVAMRADALCAVGKAG